MSASSPSVRDYLRVFFRRKWAVIVPGLAGLLCAEAVWAGIPPVRQWLPPQYRAVANVRRKDLAVLSSAPRSLISGQNMGISINTLRVEILTWTNLDRVIRQTNMDLNLQTPKDWQEAYEGLRKSITLRAAAQDRGVHQVQIEVVDGDAEKAAAVANAIADNYIEESKKTIRNDSQSVMDFFQDGRDDYRTKLKENERKLDGYREAHFADLPEVKAGILSQLLALRTEQASRRVQCDEGRNRLAEVRKQFAEVPERITGEVAKEPNPRVAELEAQLARQRRLLDSLLLKYTDAVPVVKEVRGEIAGLERELAETPRLVPGSELDQINPLYQELLKEKLDLERQLKAQEAALLGIEARIGAMEQQLKAMQDEEKAYNDLLRDHNENAEAYDAYRRGLIAARTRVDVEQDEGYGTQVEMVARALVPAFPYRVAHRKWIMALVVGGIALGVGLAFGLEFCDRSFRGFDDAATFLDVPVLGSICTIAGPDALARRRKGRLLRATVGLLAVVAAALLAVEGLRPGTFADVLQRLT